MKSLKRILLFAMVTVLLLGMVACTPREAKQDQFARGLFDLILDEKFFDYLEPDAPINYGEGLAGEVAKLGNTSSSKIATTLRVSSLNTGMEFDNYARGKSLRIDSFYNATNGQTLAQFDGFGVNGEFALDKNQLYLDIPMLLGNQAYVLPFASELKFSGNIPFTDRFRDLSEALAKEFEEEGSGSATVDFSNLRDIRNHFMQVLAKSVNPQDIIQSETSMILLGTAEKVDELRLNLNNKDAAKIIESILKETRKNNELLDLIAELLMSYPEYTYYMSNPSVREIKDDLITQIDDALEEAENDFYLPDDLDIEIALYFRKPAFLSFAKPEPVAIKFTASVYGDSIDAFVKHISEGRQFDFELVVDTSEGSGHMTLSNTLVNNTYQLKGNLTLPDNLATADIRGETIPGKNNETGNYTITVNGGDYLSWMGFDSGVLKINTELYELKKSAEYQQKISIDLDVASMGQSINGKLDIESFFNFSKSMDIQMPDFTGARQFDNIGEFLDELMYNF